MKSIAILSFGFLVILLFAAWTHGCTNCTGGGGGGGGNFLTDDSGANILTGSNSSDLLLAQ